MSKKKIYTPFQHYHSMAPDGAEKRYARLACSMMQSPAVQGLSHTAYRLFIEMMMNASWKPEFNFSRSTYRKFIANSTFDRAIHELEKAGIIRIVEHNKNLRKSNLYGWSNAWKPVPKA